MRVLMCPPSYYGIEYEINPWMRCSRPSNYRLAREQWQTLYELLRDRLHVEVSLIEPGPGLPDMVFTANAGFVWEKKFIVGNFRHDVRRGEAAYFENWFASRNYEILIFPNRTTLRAKATCSCTRTSCLRVILSVLPLTLTKQ